MIMYSQLIIIAKQTYQDISGGNAGAQKMFLMMLQRKHYKSIATFLKTP